MNGPSSNKATSVMPLALRSTEQQASLVYFLPEPKQASKQTQCQANKRA